MILEFGKRGGNMFESLDVQNMAAIAATGTVLGYIIKALFDKYLGRDTQGANADQTRTHSQVNAVQKWQEIAMKAEQDRKDTLERLDNVHDQLRELRAENHTLKKEIEFLRSKVNSICGKEGGRPAKE